MALASNAASAKSVSRPGRDEELDSGGQDEASFAPLSRQEVERLRAARPGMSLWTVVAVQAGVGLGVFALAWVLTGQGRVAWSAGYGALAVVLPAIFFARGLSRQKATAGASLAGFFVWEMVKIALTVAMLVAAPRLIKDVSWLALLAGFVVTMKVYWVAMWFRPAPKPSVEKS
jgi:ATP synthase protein I